MNEIFVTELPSANTYFVLLSEGNRSSVEAALRQLIFILTLIATFCLMFFLYFLYIKQFVCLKPKEQSIMWSTNISEAMQAAKSVCLTADDRFWRMLIIRNETMCWCDSGLWTKSFFFSPYCSEYDQLLIKTFLCGAACRSTEWGKEQQAVLTLKEFSFTSISKITSVSLGWFHKLQKFSVHLFKKLDWNTENRQIEGITQLWGKLQWAVLGVFCQVDTLRCDFHTFCWKTILQADTPFSFFRQLAGYYHLFLTSLSNYKHHI